MTNNNLMTFFHLDLDGIVSYLLTTWTFPTAQIDFSFCNGADTFYKTYMGHFNQNNKLYDKIYILDLDVSSSYNIFENKDVFIVDHHKSHINNMPSSRNKNTKVCVKEYSSCVKLLYELYKKLYNIDLSKEKKYLVALADDYDSYKLSVPESRKLNTIFWNSSENNYERVQNFINWFKNGYFGWTQEHLDILKKYDDLHETMKKNMEVYEGLIKIGGKDRKVLSTFATQNISGMLDVLLGDYKAEIAIAVNLDTNHVSFRKGKDINVDLSKLAKGLCNGGGHEYAAGGVITDEFMMFTKNLEKIS